MRKITALEWRNDRLERNKRFSKYVGGDTKIGLNVLYYFYGRIWTGEMSTLEAKIFGAHYHEKFKYGRGPAQAFVLWHLTPQGLTHADIGVIHRMIGTMTYQLDTWENRITIPNQACLYVAKLGNEWHLAVVLAIALHMFQNEEPFFHWDLEALKTRRFRQAFDDLVEHEVLVETETKNSFIYGCYKKYASTGKGWAKHLRSEDRDYANGDDI